MKRILDKIPRPPGALPARAQTWVLLGLTGVLVVALLLFPGDPEARPSQDVAEVAMPGPARTGTPVGVQSAQSAARRMREEAAREAEQRMRSELGVPAERPDGLPNPPTPLVQSGPIHAGGHSNASGLTPEEQIRREEALRRYRSLSAAPLVLSHRDAMAAQAGSAAGPANDPGGEAAEIASAPVPETPAVAEEADRTEILREGEFLEAVLTNRLSGDFSGPVNAMVSADVYDRSGQRLLIPRGTRALGEALQVEAWEQSRLAVTFHRLILPDGRAVRLDQSAALNQIGETGLLDLVDRRYPSAFLAAGAIGALAGLSSAVSPTQALVSRFGAARQSVGAGLSQSAERMLDRYLNRLPKLTVREGHRIRIYLTADLTVRPYHDPPGPTAGPAFQGESL